MNRRLLTFLFVLMDFCTAAAAWGAFFWYRKTEIEHTEFITNETFWIGIFLIPVFWIILYKIAGTYEEIIRLHRFKIVGLTLGSTLLGTLLLFFLLLLDDQIDTYEEYYQSLFSLFAIHLTFTLVPRYILTSYIVGLVQQRKIGFNTLLIGGSEHGVKIYEELEALPKSMGHRFVGFVNLNGIDTLLQSRIPYLGHAKKLETVMAEHNIEEVIIALDSTEQDKLKELIARLSRFEVKIKLIPNMYDIVSGSVKMNNIFGALLVEVNSDVMPHWQRMLKRLLDIFLSAVAIILLLPVYIILALAVKVSSKGPVFFLQERIGKKGKPFHIIKFRTMYTDAEKAGPQLSSTNDPRITPIGRFLRKMRLDEFPQFINVIKGDMSLVGPRPERQFYIDQIAAREPQFLELTKVRPGITSWGQVKYGYAENVDQMIQRMKFDLLYMKNMSLALDFKIMLYTILIILKAKGK
jgi:exopolysaccharide biosynthesis polyprenyl glycosylphosphotransferase